MFELYPQGFNPETCNDEEQFFASAATLGISAGANAISLVMHFEYLLHYKLRQIETRLQFSSRQFLTS